MKRFMLFGLLCVGIGSVYALEERVEFEYFFPEGSYRFLHEFPRKEVLNQPPRSLLDPKVTVESKTKYEWKQNEGKVTYEPNWEFHWSREW